MTERLPGAETYDAAEPAPEVTWGGVWSWVADAWVSVRTGTASRSVVVVALVAILCLGAALRFTGLNWDDHQHLHPDERFLTMVENSLQWPQSLGQYWNTAENPLNPYNYGHGSYVYGLSPVVLAKFIGQVTGYTGYDGVYLAGRAMSGVMDLLCVLLVFLIGKRLYGVRAGLLGSLLLALSVLNIQQSHYFTVDSTTTFFVTLAFYLAVRVAQGQGWGSILALGIAFGLAVSAKVSVLTFLLVIGLALALRVYARWQAQRGQGSAMLANLRGRLGQYEVALRIQPMQGCGAVGRVERLIPHVLAAGVALIVMLVAAAIVFRVVQPQAFTGPGFFGLSINPQWRDDMSYIQKLVSGQIDYPPSHQWTGRPAVWYALENMVLWGLGLPLGLAVWASWGLAAYQMLRPGYGQDRRWAHLLPWAWMTFTFFFQSIQFVKTVRYMLPIYPTMAVLAGFGLVWLWDRARVARPSAVRWTGLVARLAVAAVVLGTAFWAFAFTGIYTRPGSRIAASHWIYEHIPPGSSISFEMWDDPVPLNLDGRIGDQLYNTVRMEPYWEDTPEKREALYQWLEQTEYIALSSNRLYGSIPRLPGRYPMTTRYYETLFSGELGYDHLVTFTSRPQLLGLEIVDDDADESFTVYDHPKVTLFKKRADFSMQKVRALFDGYDLERIARIMPIQASKAPTGLMLDSAEWSVQKRAGTWSDIFDRQSLANRMPVLVWYVLVWLLGLLAFPLGFVAFRGLRDRGYILSRTLGVLLLGYLAWLPASLRLLTFSRATLSGVLLALGALALVVAWRQRRALSAFLRARWRLLLVNELFFLAFFGALLLVRYSNPDLWHPVMGGEKPMDLAYLNAVVKSTSFPPYDPWFAGGYINYYYWGLVPVAALIKLTGILPEVAYNLAVPTLFALTAMGACSVAMNLMPADEDEGRWLPRALRYGLLGALFVAVLGNLGEAQLLWNGLRDLGRSTGFESGLPGLAPLVHMVAGLSGVLFGGQSLPFRPEWWYWNASRIMQNGEINEFPFFTFLYADLHAHLTALPFALLALGLAVSLVLGRTAPRPSDALDGETPRLRRLAWLPRLNGALLLQLSLLGLVLGELWCNNTWDLPTYAALGVAALAIALYAERGRIDQGGLERLVLRSGYVLVLAVLLFWPYHSHSASAYSSVDLWKGARTPLGAYLLIWALPLTLLAAYLPSLTLGPGARSAVARAVRLYLAPPARRIRAQHLYRLLVRCQTLGYDTAWSMVLFLGVLWVGFLFSGAWVLWLNLPLLVLACALAMERHASPRRRFLMVLSAAGLALTIGVEYVVIKGDIGRMNTVFKFYLQVWVLWGIVAAVGLGHLAGVRLRWPQGLRRVWTTVMALVILGAALYPPLAAMGKGRDRWDAASQPPGLNGMAYMATARYQDAGRDLTLAHDQAAITWMQDHIQGTPVIVEAVTPLYRWGGRVSVYTGLPTVVGWDWHQRQQRGIAGGERVDWRLWDVNDLYNTTDIGLAARLLARYGVGYIYVGELEQAYYDPQGLAKFDQMVGSLLEVAYESGPVTIYRVVGSGASEVAEGPAREDSVAQWWARLWIPGSVRAEGPQDPSGDGGSGSPMLDGPVDELPILTDRGWNAPARTSTLLAILSWWLVLELVGLAAWPLVARALGGLADKGYGLAKGIGLLLVSYGVWMAASLRVAANSPPLAWAVLIALGIVSLGLWRKRFHELAMFWWQNRRLLLLEEGVFVLAFLAFVVVRLLNPDLWQPWFGGEKMMEIAFLNALTRSAYMPPYDPYFAGGTINYYYYGQFIVAVLIKLTGVLPEVAFNLAVPTFFALTVSHAFVVGQELGAGARRSVWPGLAAVGMVALAANLTGIVQLVRKLGTLGGAVFQGLSTWATDLVGIVRGFAQVVTGQGQLPPFEYWYEGTRIIPYTINEFPFFSFLFADLHPHLIGLPFTVLVAALVVNLIRLGRSIGRWPILAISLGALGVINTWDLPAYLGLTALVMLYCGYRTGSARGLFGALSGLLVLSGSAVLLYAPFYANYRPQDVGLALVPPDGRSPLGPFLKMWGLHLFVALSALAWALARSASCRRLALAARRWRWGRLLGRLARLSRGTFALSIAQAALGLAALGAMPLLARAGVPVFALVMPLALLAGLLLWVCAQRWRSCPQEMWLRGAMFLGAFAILAGIEIIYLRDFLAGSEWRRMNTVFKFGLQAWVLMGLAGGSALPSLWARAKRAGGWGLAWRISLSGLLVASAVYVVASVPVRVGQRFPGERPPVGTLDGTAYMTTGVFTFPNGERPVELAYDREAIAWLWEHVQGTPVLVEAPLGYYREGGLRVSSYTGLPTLLGAHENEMRPAEQVAVRQRDADLIYQTEDPAALFEVLARQRVRYIYVGQLERYTYAEAGLNKFEMLAQEGRLQRAYRNARVTIYQVPEEILMGEALGSSLQRQGEAVPWVRF
ncbi:MAG: DUF2298 domain-containing protein [Anaerolineae bacterium]